MTVQATAISKWGTKPPGAPDGEYRFTEAAGETKEAAIERAERVNARLGGAFAVVWDEGDSRQVRMASSGEEMSWEDFLTRHGVEVGLLDAGGAR
jgi:hypothetical protein